MAMMLNMMMSQNKGFQKVTEETFTNIQIEFYTSLLTEGIIAADREFTEKIVEEWSSEMYELIIKKSYLSIDNIKDINTLSKWSSIWYSFEWLANYEGFCEYLINSPYFLPPLEKINGKILQQETIFGRMLSITLWPTENSEHNTFEGVSKMRPDGHSRVIKTAADKFYAFYDRFQSLLK